MQLNRDGQQAENSRESRCSRPRNRLYCVRKRRAPSARRDCPD